MQVISFGLHTPASDGREEAADIGQLGCFGVSWFVLFLFEMPAWLVYLTMSRPTMTVLLRPSTFNYQWSCLGGCNTKQTELHAVF